MPLYGRASASTSSPFSGTGEGSWEQVVWDFKALLQRGAKKTMNKKIGACWSYDAEKLLMISYDSTELTKQKEVIKKENLEGAMWWDSSGDKKGEESLIGTVSC